MSFLEWYRKLSEEPNQEEIPCTYVSDDDYEDSDDDDEWSTLVDYDSELPELNERLIRKIVFRNGKRVIKFVSDKDTYRVQMKNGRPTEVRMKPDEILRRRKSQRLASRKRQSGLRQSITKRNRTLVKRKTSNL